VMRISCDRLSAWVTEAILSTTTVRIVLIAYFVPARW
jgi:hypothetical protein